jgi:adenylylsulfate kinase
MAPSAPNLFWSEPTVTRAERFGALRSIGATVWFTGLSGSGKSTIASALERSLVLRGVRAYRLDGDNIRQGLNADLGFSAEHRAENIRRIGEVARLFADSGCLALASFISPSRADRDLVRAMHRRPPARENISGAGGTHAGERGGGWASDEPALEFFEVFVDAPLSLCEQRDPKGLYKKARAGELKGFTGIDDPYQPPVNPDLVLNTATMSVEACVGACIGSLAARGVLAP